MSKYQFFCKPNTNRKEFTFLNSDSDSFLREKEQLLVQGGLRSKMITFTQKLSLRQ